MKRSFAILVLVLSACSRTAAPPPSQSIACHVATQQRCKEFPSATTEQLTNLPVECSSVSGLLSKPANCPTSTFVGKCTMGSGTAIEIKRVYKGVDAAYEKDFCENTAHGAWSTAF